MRRLTKMAIVSVVLVIGAGTLAACSHQPRTPEERADWMVNKISDKLDLNDAQKAKLEVVKTEMMKLRTQFDGDKATRDKKMLEIVSKPKMDRDALLNMINARTEAVSSNAPQIVTALGDFYDSLNPDQQAKVRKEMKEKMEHRWHH
jgi:Spy/CpxP family protein refolding chaperone